MTDPVVARRSRGAGRAALPPGSVRRARDLMILVTVAAVALTGCSVSSVSGPSKLDHWVDGLLQSTGARVTVCSDKRGFYDWAVEFGDRENPPFPSGVSYGEWLDAVEPYC